jgi:hypothetical protein
MVSLASYAASSGSTDAALGEIGARIAADKAEASFVYAFYGCEHDDHAIHAFLRHHFPYAAILGGSSCAGVMTEQQLWGRQSIGLLLIDDSDGDYGAASVRLGDDPVGSAEKALHAALDSAGCAGELPELIWIFQAPGHEEEVIEGLRRVVGDRCPIIGGSSADNTVEGNWHQIGPGGVMTDGLTVAVLFPSGGIGYSFQGGYEPAGPSGIVTRIGYDATGASGIVTKARGREIAEIDGLPASQIYNGWIGCSLDDKLDSGGNILSDTTMWPLAVDAGQIEGIPHYILIHPDAITSTGALTTFASIEEGTRVYSMRGEKRQLVERAGRVAAQAAAEIPGGPSNLAGGLVVYCAGCMLAVDDRMPDVVNMVSESFHGQPFLGCFTFGEQGCIVDRNVHGNLMISAIAFGR